MAASLTIPLLLAVCYLFAPSPPFSAAAEETDLAIQVCKNTTDFAFCRAAVYSDPHAPGADQYVLVDIIFREAYLNATGNRDYIVAEVKSGGRGLEKCLADYNEAIQILETMLNDLNSESYYELDLRSLSVERSVRACGKGSRSPLAERNGIMLKFANMCYVVSLLFEYS